MKPPVVMEVELEEFSNQLAMLVPTFDPAVDNVDNLGK